MKRFCGGECYNPSDERLLIDRIEVVRIRPQVSADEAVGDLVEDPWRVFPCNEDPTGCEVTFTDDEFVDAGREHIYYVRAIQEETPMINAANVRCEYDESGACIAVNPCFGDYRTSSSEDCTSMEQQRAWSSPIFLAFGGEPDPAVIQEVQHDVQ